MTIHTIPGMIYAAKKLVFEERFEDMEAGIQIGKGTKIEPRAVIYDSCIIGAGCIKVLWRH